MTGFYWHPACAIGPRWLLQEPYLLIWWLNQCMRNENYWNAMPKMLLDSSGNNPGNIPPSKAAGWSSSLSSSSLEARHSLIKHLLFSAIDLTPVGWKIAVTNHPARATSAAQGWSHMERQQSSCSCKYKLQNTCKTEVNLGDRRQVRKCKKPQHFHREHRFFWQRFRKKKSQFSPTTFIWNAITRFTKELSTHRHQVLSGFKNSSSF